MFLTCLFWLFFLNSFKNKIDLKKKKEFKKADLIIPISKCGLTESQQLTLILIWQTLLCYTTRREMELISYPHTNDVLLHLWLEAKCSCWHKSVLVREAKSCYTPVVLSGTFIRWCMVIIIGICVNIVIYCSFMNLN